MYDVLVVGYGPTGMLAAIQLGRAGHRVGVFERYKTLYNLPRVGIVHDDVQRMFQEIGCIDRILPATFFLPTYELANNGKVLLTNKVNDQAVHGWPEMTSIYQPAFEAELDVIAKSLPTVDVFQGQPVTAVSQDDEKVDITVTDDDGEERQVQGRYLIAADGGNSFIREALGVGLEDLGFDQDWLVIDAKTKRDNPGLPLLRQFCEPEQPGMTMQMGPDHRRWSFMIFPGESREDAVKPENVWRRLDRAEGGTQDDFELIRVVTYKFCSLIAEQWRVGRVFLAGDAAHQMPPFLAQGMCSGFRDAYNLAWKLDMVLSGKSGPDFLDTYMAEREPNSRATVIESLRVGQNVIERDPEKAKARDAQLVALQAEMEKATEQKSLIGFRVPGFETGFIADGGAKGAGDVFGQGRVRLGSDEGRFDDVVGRGFMIVSRDGDARRALSDKDMAFWQKLGGGFVQMAKPGAPPEGGATVDLDGRYTALMDDYGADVLVKRPDYYLFGVCPAADRLPALMAEMRGQLGG